MTQAIEQNFSAPAPSGAAAIETTGLVKSFGKVKAVAGVDLRVETGQIYALLGPNGAGKTTLINMLTTLIPPDSGMARVAGYDVVSQAAQVRRHIGVTFQETILDKSLSGKALLDIHGRLYKLPGSEIKQRITELAQLVELEEAIDRPVRTYSGGMKRRLELARGLLTRPQVLFLDEPTIGLDPHNRDRIWAYIKELRRQQGLTILLTTHYMDEAEQLADRVGIIEAGQLVIEGTPAALVSSLGSDVVSITGQGDPTTFVAALEQHDWVLFAGMPKAEATPTEEKPLDPGTRVIQVGLKIEAGRSLRSIIDLAERNGFEVVDVSLKRPSLSDVFFKYTGRRLRD